MLAKSQLCVRVLRLRSGEVVNHKCVHRVYREAGLALRRKKRKQRVRQSSPQRLHTAARFCARCDRSWSGDLRAERGRRLHTRVSGVGSG